MKSSVDGLGDKGKLNKLPINKSKKTKKMRNRREDKELRWPVLASGMWTTKGKL